MSFAESWKSLGNQAFQQGNFELSLEHFTKAIEVDPSNAVYYCNRSLSYASLKNWDLSMKDASVAIKLDPKKPKGHFRYAKALIELNQFADARTALHTAIKECGDKDFKSLEDSIFEKTGIPLRPKSTDFEIICELGDGNFSKVYKTYLKKNKKIFAIKVR
jgi:tetratricopeptide (TPR) repeat protein